MIVAIGGNSWLQMQLPVVRSGSVVVDTNVDSTCEWFSPIRVPLEMSSMSAEREVQCIQ